MESGRNSRLIFLFSATPALAPGDLEVAGTAAVGLQAPAANAKGQNSLHHQELCSQESKMDPRFSSSTPSSANVAPDVGAAGGGTQQGVLMKTPLLARRPNGGSQEREGIWRTQRRGLGK